MTQLLDLPRSAFSIDEFCMRNAISRGTLYNYWRDKVGPRYMKVRGRRLITAEAEQDWHREREAASRPAEPAKQTVRRRG